MKKLLLLSFIAYTGANNLSIQASSLTDAIQSLNTSEVENSLKKSSNRLTADYKAQILAFADEQIKENKKAIKIKSQVSKYIVGSLAGYLGIIILKNSLQLKYFLLGRSFLESTLSRDQHSYTKEQKDLMSEIVGNRVVIISTSLGLTATIFGVKTLYKAITKSEEYKAYEKALAIYALIEKTPMQFS